LLIPIPIPSPIRIQSPVDEREKLLSTLIQQRSNLAIESTVLNYANATLKSANPSHDHNSIEPDLPIRPITLIFAVNLRNPSYHSILMVPLPLNNAHAEQDDPLIICRSLKDQKLQCIWFILQGLELSITQLESLEKLFLNWCLRSINHRTL
jgi:hypothetical protein